MCVNLGSYNYLGFADDWHSSCKASVMEALERFSPCTSSSFADAGTTTLHRELENVMARFVGKPAALCYNMGYGTNSASIPALIGKGCLILSDSLNHTSIVNGSRSSGATIRVFKHNGASNTSELLPHTTRLVRVGFMIVLDHSCVCVRACVSVLVCLCALVCVLARVLACVRNRIADSEQLEAMLRDAIVTGQPRTHRPWRKILVMVEGIYSMEGQIVDLKNIVRVAKQYKALVYLDEAHSIGALGATGRGACEHCGVSPDDVDILMGTFTKSFGAMGGYIAGSREFIDFLRANSAGTLYGNAMSPVVCKQILRAFEVIEGRDGTDTGAKKLRAVKENSNYFRRRLIELGAEVVGDWDSPVIPIMIYNPTKIAAFSRECLDRGLAVVVVGFPAVPLVLSRTRFCVSAGHSKEVLDKALEKVDEVLRVLKMRYRFSPFG